MKRKNISLQESGQSSENTPDKSNQVLNEEKFLIDESVNINDQAVIDLTKKIKKSIDSQSDTFTPRVISGATLKLVPINTYNPVTRENQQKIANQSNRSSNPTGGCYNGVDFSSRDGFNIPSGNNTVSIQPITRESDPIYGFDREKKFVQTAPILKSHINQTSFLRNDKRPQNISAVHHNQKVLDNSHHSRYTPLSPSPKDLTIQRFTHALNNHRKKITTPAYDKPFASYNDFVSQLLPFHLCHTFDKTEEELEEDQLQLSADIVSKYEQFQNMRERLFCIQMKSMPSVDPLIQYPSFADILIDRLFVQHLSETLSSERNSQPPTPQDPQKCDHESVEKKEKQDSVVITKKRFDEK